MGRDHRHFTHLAVPTSARHGVPRGRIDVSARTIWLLEKLGRVWNVHWPTPQRLAKLARQR